MVRSNAVRGGEASATGWDRRLALARQALALLRGAVEDVIGSARRAGFELLDIQSLRPHYALTLNAWVERLEASVDRARELVDEEVYRTWRIYIAAARRGVEDSSLDVAQLLLAGPSSDGPARLPLRPWWHR